MIDLGRVLAALKSFDEGHRVRLDVYETPAHKTVRMHLHAQQRRIKQLEAAEQRAFWWSAQFTRVVHDNNIQRAWEDYRLLKNSCDENEEGEYE